MFAEFVNQFLLEIEQAVDTYLTEYNPSFYTWIETSVSPMAADEIAQDWGEVVEVARLIKQLFAGEAITIGDDESSTQTNCRGPRPQNTPVDLVACQISF